MREREAPMRTNEITRRIIAAAYTIHSKLGPGLLESAYGACLAMELHDLGLRFRKEHRLPLLYNGRDAGCGYVADFLVENTVIVELKSVVRMQPLFTAQVITYLKLSGCEVGLLMNFNVSNMQTGIKRVVLGFRGE
jgi:GxxExxY protein